MCNALFHKESQIRKVWNEYVVSLRKAIKENEDQKSILASGAINQKGDEQQKEVGLKEDQKLETIDLTKDLVAEEMIIKNAEKVRSWVCVMEKSFPVGTGRQMNV